MQQIKCTIAGGACPIKTYFEGNNKKDTNDNIELLLTVELGEVGDFRQGWARLFDPNYMPRVKSIVLQTAMDELPQSAFRNFTSVETIKLPEGMVTIGSSAFEGCTSLTTCILSSTIRTLDGGAFSKCLNLQNVNVDNVTSAGPSCFQGCSKLETIDLSNLKKMSWRCFENCSMLTNVTFGESLAEIGSQAFYNCKKFKAYEKDMKGVALAPLAFWGTQLLPIPLESGAGEEYPVTGWGPESQDLQTLATKYDELQNKDMWRFIVPGTDHPVNNISLDDLYDDFANGKWAVFHEPWQIKFEDRSIQEHKRRKIRKPVTGTVTGTVTRDYTPRAAFTDAGA